MATNVPQTPNFKLFKPLFDRKAWHQYINKNMEIIDAVLTTYLDVGNIVGVWENSTSYTHGDRAIDPDVGQVFEAAQSHISSPAPKTFAEEREDNPTYWTSLAVTARGLGAWAPGTLYQPNDFVVSGNIYAVCIATHTSSSNFVDDAVYWDYLIDLSSLPTLPSFVGQSLNVLRVNNGETSAEWVDETAIIAWLGLGAAAFENVVPVSAGGTGANTAVGARDNLEVHGLFKSQQIFTASGTWNKPAGLKRVKVTVVGGGGAGGGGDATAAGQCSVGGGGGGGGMGISLLEAASLASSVAVTVGAGGTGVAGAAGNSGDPSSFGAHCVANGGSGGTIAAASAAVSPAGQGGTGGGVSVGQIKVRGQPGGCGFRNAAGTGVQGSGGASGIGYGGIKGDISGVSASGVAADSNSGAGGSGAINIGVSGNRTGGPGGSGLVIVEEYF